MTTLLDKMEKRFGKYAIPNLTLILLIGQIAVWLLANLSGLSIGRLLLAPAAVVQGGEWWRVISFFFVPKITSMSIWAAFAFYIFYLCGSTLENAWGHFRYNCFIFSGAALTVLFVLGAFFALPPQVIPFVGNSFFLASIFIAFTILNPNYEFLLFFILPIKVKWLGWLAAFYWVLELVGGPPYGKAAVLAAALNVGLFFGREWFVTRKYRRRAKVYHARNQEAAAEPFHRCCVCNVTDNDEPDLRFAYKDGKGYCERHWDSMD